MNEFVFVKVSNSLKEALHFLCNLSHSVKDSLTHNINDWCDLPGCDCWRPIKGELDYLFEQADIVDRLLYSTAYNELIRDIDDLEYGEYMDYINSEDFKTKVAETADRARKEWEYTTEGGVLFGWIAQPNGTYITRIGFQREGGLTKAARESGMTEA